MISVPNIINIAKASQYLATNAILRGGLFGRGLDALLPRKLYCIRKNVEWLYNLSPNEDTLQGVANYLYALCAPFLALAQVVIAAGGGGVIVNPFTGGNATLADITLEFELGVTSSPVVVNGVNVTLPSDGDNTITLPLQYVMSGSIEVVVGGTPQPVIPTTNSTYVSISYSPTQVIITLQPTGTVFQNGNTYKINGLQFVSA
jgi:hypothetical protein